MNFAGPFDSDLTHDSPVSLGGERFSFATKPGFVQHHASDSHVVVPDAHLLFSGDYTRIGSDLIISGNGQKFVVGNYFKGETRPALTSKDGATLAGHIVDALTGHVHYAQATAAPAAGAIIGHVLKLSGSATVIRNGVSIDLHIGDAVQKGDVVQTGSDSTVGMTFIDGSAFGMTSNARMVLNEMIFDPNGSSNSSLISLVQGTVTFVAGQTAKNGNMRVETPVATMGIRGTAVLVEIGANDGPTKFSVLVEPDGHTGSYNLYDKVTGQLIGTVSQAGQVTFVSSLGIGQPPTAIEQLKTLADQQAEKAIIQQVFQLYFPNYNPDDSNPKLPKFGSNTSGNNLAEILFTTNSNNKQTFLTQVELRFAVIDPLTGITTYQSKIFYNTKAVFSATAVLSEQALVSTVESFKIADVVHIDDPDIGNAPFYDVGVPFVAGSAVIKSAVSTNPHLDANFLKQFLHIDQTTGVVSFDRLGFNFLGDGESVTFMLEVTARSGPDTAQVVIPITITGDNDVPNDNGVPNGAPTIVLSLSDIIGAIKEDTLVTPDHAIVSHGTITFRDVDLSDTHTVAKDFTSASSTLPGFTGAPLGTFTIDLDPENTTDIVNTGTVQWHFSLPENDPTLQSLAEGQTITQVYTITITDEHGAFVTQTVTITITGTNDAPVLTADTTSVHQAAEIFNSTNSLVEDVVSGTLTFTDLDLTDTHQAVATLGSGSGAVVWSGGAYSGIPAATVTALNSAMSAVVSENNADTNIQGSVTWQFKLPDHLFDFLGHSETLTVTYNVKVADYNNGVATGTYSTQQVTVQITANNDKPVVTAITPDGAVQEDAPVATGDLLQVSGSVTFADADLTDTHTVQATYVGAAASSGASVSPGLATALATTALSVPSTALAAATHTFNWDFSLANSLVQYLAVGETVTATYTIKVTDNSGVIANSTSAPQTVTVTITGTNDAPVITSASGAASATVAELTATTGSASLDPASGTVTFGDVDLTDTHQVTQSTATFAWSGGELTPAEINNLTNASVRTLVPHDSTGTGNGSIDWTYKIADSALDFLAVTQTLTVTYDITVADYHNGVATGTSTIQKVTVTYTGSNDAPTVAAVTTPTALVDTAAADTFVAQTGTLVGTDVDSDETNGLTYAVLDADGHPALTVGGPGHYGSLTVNADGTYSYVPNASAINALNDGAYADTFTVQTTDAHNATGTATFTVNITGANDTPTVSASVPDHLIESTSTDAGVPSSVATLSIADVDGTVNYDSTALATDGWTYNSGADTYTKTGIYGTATLDAAHNLTYALDNNLAEGLTSSDHPVETFRVPVIDDHGLTAFTDVSFTVDGSDDPVNQAPALNGGGLVAVELGGGTTQVSGVLLSDPGETDNLTFSAAADHGTVTKADGTTALDAPGGVSETLANINGILTDGIIYTPDNLVPTDHVLLTVTDSHGLSDTLNLLFNQSGTSGATLVGSTGKDIFFATGSPDTFVFAPNSNHDTIMGGFAAGIDKIDLQALTSFDTVALTALLNTADHIGGDTLLHLNGTTDTLLLKGVATLNASDFILHA